MIISCAVSWAKSNPLKISGIAGAIAEILTWCAGEYRNDLAMAIAGFFGFTACLTLWIYGRGGREGVSFFSAAVRASSSFALIKKCLFFWRFPAESSSFQQGLAGTSYIICGILNHELPLGAVGSLCIAMAFAVTSLPEKPGWRNPMVIGASLQGVATLFIAKAALDLQSWLLGLAVVAFVVNDVTFGISLRHENKGSTKT